MNKTCSQLSFLLVLALVIMPVSGEGNITNTTVIPTTTVSNITATIVPPTPANTTGTPVPATTTILPVTTVTNVTIVTTQATQPSASTGDIFVVSSPAGANVLIDGSYRGSTPVNLTSLAAGNHILRLSLSGYYDYEGSIYVVPGQITNAYGTLPPMGNGNQQTLQNTPATVPPTPATIIVTVTVPTVPPTSTPTPVPTGGGILESPTLLAAIIGVITASLGAAAAFLTHIGKFRKD